MVAFIYLIRVRRHPTPKLLCSQKVSFQERVECEIVSLITYCYLQQMEHNLLMIRAVYFSSHGGKTLRNDAVLWYSFMLRILESPGTASCWENLLSHCWEVKETGKYSPQLSEIQSAFSYYLKNKVLKLAASVFREKRVCWANAECLSGCYLPLSFTIYLN